MCSEPGCDVQDVLLPHSFREVNLGSAEKEDCNPINGDSFNYFRKIQYRLTINAKNWKLEDIRVKAESQPDDGKITIECSDVPKLVVKDCTDVADLALYRTPLDTFGDVSAWQ